MDTIYKRDTNGVIRFWRMEIDHVRNRYRTVSGVNGGAATESGWTVTKPKNVGRSNETSAVAQALLEVEAEYRKKRELGYFDTPEAVDGDRFFQPMLAHKYEGWTGPCFSQPKLDGIRCIATVDGLWSRKGKRIYGVPHIEEALAPRFLEDPNRIFDGELYNHELKDDFNKITSLVKKLKPTEEDLEQSRKLIQYHVYDLPSCLDTFSMRSWKLLDQIQGISPFLVYVNTYACDSELALDYLYADCLQEGFEGQIIRLDASYENKRSKNLLKRKEFKDSEFPILRIEEGLGNWAGYAKSVICSLPDGREFGAGLKGNQAYALQVLKDAESYVGKMAMIRYFTETPDGIPRFPIAYELGRAM